MLKAFIIKTGDIDEETLVSELKAACEQQLPENMRPYFYELVDEFPRTPAGKIDYRALES